MALTEFSGPVYVAGDLQALPAAFAGTSEPSSNPDSGPSMLFEGFGYPDSRYPYLKDRISGYTGVYPQTLFEPAFTTLNVVPAAHSATLVAAAANTVSGTAMTLASTLVYGRTPGIPVVPFTGSVNGAAPVTPAMCLDFGFCYGTTTTGGTAATVTVLDSTLFYVGMPIVIAGVGAASGTTPLFTLVQSVPTATTITVGPNLPLQALSVPIGMGNVFGPSENGWPVPNAHMPAYARGPGLFYDPRQMLGRGLVVVCNSASGAGGTFTVAGYDVYGNAQTEAIVSAPASATTVYGLKSWKWITSVTPNFTDASFTYSVGTSDVIGLPRRLDVPELSQIWWAGALITSVANGFVKPDLTSPATSATGCPEGTVQLSAIGGSGTGISSTATNGSVSTITISGNRLVLRQAYTLWQQLNDRVSNTVPAFGPTPA